MARPERHVARREPDHAFDRACVDRVGMGNHGSVIAARDRAGEQRGLADPSPVTKIGTPIVREESGSLSLDFDNGAVQSQMLQADPARLVLEYTRRMMGFLLLHPAPKRIAMIGLGGGSLAKYCAWKLPDADFTAIEISPQVIELRETFGIPPDGPRFRILCADGAEFVRREGEPLDVLLVDGFDRGGQPDDLCSAAFYDYCRDALGAGGVLAVNSYGDGPGDDVRLDRLRDAFGGRVVFVDVDGSENRVMFAGTSPSFPPAFAELVERLRALEASHPVGLDVTLRKILQYTEPRNPGRRRRRLLAEPRAMDRWAPRQRKIAAS